MLSALFGFALALHSQSGDTSGAARQRIGRSDAKLLHLLQNRQYIELETALRATRAGDPLQRAFFEGVLANRSNRLEVAERLLRPLLSSGTRPLEPAQAGIAWRTLADTYTKMFRYAEAADTYRQMFQRLGPSLSQPERDDAEGTRQMVEGLRWAPAQTVDLGAGFIVPTRRNALHTIEAPVTVGGHIEHWILDTGANVSIVTRSKAAQLGLSLSENTTPVHTFSGAVANCHLSVIPSIRFSQTELRNVAVLVIDDKDFYVGPAHFQMEALLGYPALAALGRITFHRDGRLEAHPSDLSPDTIGARLLLEELTPLVVVGTANGERLFRIDTGATNSYLTVRYWKEHRRDFAGQKLGESRMDGGNGVRSIPSYTAKTLKLLLGGAAVNLRDVAVFTRPHGDGEEYAYGHLGQNALAQFRSYTFDFAAMRFAVAP